MIWLPPENGGCTRCERLTRISRHPTSKTSPRSRPARADQRFTADRFARAHRRPPRAPNFYLPNVIAHRSVANVTLKIAMKQLLRLGAGRRRRRPWHADARKLDADQRRRTHLPRLAALPRPPPALAWRRHHLGMVAPPACVCRRAAGSRPDRRRLAATPAARRSSSRRSAYRHPVRRASRARRGDRSPCEYAVLGGSPLGDRDGAHRRAIGDGDLRRCGGEPPIRQWCFAW